MRLLQCAVITLCFSVTEAAWGDPPDLCCATDVTGDGVVDEADLDYCTPFAGTDNPECDFDGNGSVGPSDFTILAACEGTTCAARVPSVTARVPSLTPTGVGLAAGLMVATAAWVDRRRRNSG